MTAQRLILLSAGLLLSSCGDHSMTQQNRYGTFTSAALFENGSEAQPLPKGVVAQGDLARAQQASTPPSVDLQLLSRGRQRYEIYCSPCHGLSGSGDGMIVRRGFPAPPSYHTARLRGATAQHIFDVISNGYGVMYAYGSRVEPQDRWAIVAYVRALQQAQRATVADVPDLGSKIP
jgi:mono/diheme cytochrome c family protein